MNPSFPVFEVGKGLVDELDIDKKPLSSAVFPESIPSELPTIHDGREQAANEALYRLRMQYECPQLLRALDLKEKREREHATWLQRCAQLAAVISAKETRMAQRRSAGDGDTVEELRRELVALHSQLDEAREECAASKEELEHAQSEVNALQGVA